MLNSKNPVELSLGRNNNPNPNPRREGTTLTVTSSNMGDGGKHFSWEKTRRKKNLRFQISRDGGLEGWINFS